MENRERDRVSQRSSSTEAGDINRKTSQEESRSSGSAEFGQKIGRSENLSETEGETMDNKNRNRSDFNEEPSRRPSGDEGYGSSQGRQGSTDVERESNLNENESDRSRKSGSMGSSNIGSSRDSEH